ncbi:MAG: NADH-quinone oxidoreductase subunit M [Planctomycetes bacterium]|nr:NADH-quinone oxidoreductase subunit M [Planctomycetota bacterium]
MSLTLLTFLPLAGALAIVALPGHKTALLRAIALGTTLVTAVVGVLIYAAFDGTQVGAQMGETASWFVLPGGTEVHYRLGLDGLSVLMVGLTSVLMPVVLLSTWGHVSERVKEFLVWMLVMETGMLGVFLALDLVLFYVFWEVSLIPLYFLVGIWGGERRLYATVKFFLFTLFGSLVMMIGVIALLWQFDTSDVVVLSDRAAELTTGQQIWYFLAFALAFSIKVPLIPFHTWLADAHTEAPTSGSVVLAGVLLKMGTYGLLRFGIAMFPSAAIELAPLFMALGAIGIVYGALLSMAQTDLKRLVACSSVSHLGYVVLGMFSLTSAGLAGGVLQMVNHGLSTGLLFLLVGMVYERRHTRALDQFGGIAAVMPIYAVFLMITVLSSAGLPGLNGFVGEYLILLGAFERSPLWAVIGVSGVILGAVYLLMATRRVLWGPIVHEANRKLSDVNLREVVLMVPMIALVAWIGVAPNTFLHKGQASLDAVLQKIEGARPRVVLVEPAGTNEKVASEGVGRPGTGSPDAVPGSPLGGSVISGPAAPETGR